MPCKMEKALFLKLAMKGDRNTNTIKVNGQCYYVMVTCCCVTTYKSKLCVICMSLQLPTQ